MFLLHVFSFFFLCFSIFGFTTSLLSLSPHFYSHQAQTTCWDHPKMTELYHALGEKVKLCSYFFCVYFPLWNRDVDTQAQIHQLEDDLTLSVIYLPWTSNYNLIFHPTPEMSTALVLTRGQLGHNPGF